MIGQLRGKIIEKHPPELIIDVHGVGYAVFAPMSTFYQLADHDQEITLFTQLIVREDAHQLYGFVNKAERTLFRTLLKVNGVGPKVALAILSSTEPNAFVQSIIDNDTAALVRLPGIGKKTAERLVIEMRDKLQDWFADLPAYATDQMQSTQEPTLSTYNEAISALVALGYKPAEAQRAVKAVNEQNLTIESLIRQALRQMADKNDK